MEQIMMAPHVLCSISTRGRYHTSLPLAIQSVIMQSRPPNHLIVYDDNTDALDPRQNAVYDALFRIMTVRGISWEWIWAGKKGQHHNHQMANQKATAWVWRVDDDCVAEPHVLETLLQHVSDQVGGVAGACLTPNWDQSPRSATGKIEHIDSEPNVQWGRIIKKQQVEHLHCSFLYRARICDYNLGLSRVAHREETLFTWQLHQKGYQLWVVPDVTTWHLKLDSGGIRSEDSQQLYDHDNQIFQNFLKHKDHTIVVLDCGMGDHIVFKRVLPLLKNPLVFSCYPDIIPGHSIAEAKHAFGDIDAWNIYKKMHEWHWDQSLESAYRKLYGVKS
jgi:hypothetical protein